MKLVRAVIQPYKLTDVKEALTKAGIGKMTVTNALGCGQQQGYSEGYRGVINEVNLLKKMVVEIAVNNDFVETVVETICKAAKTGSIGDGKIFILDLNDIIRIRTGERDKEAIG